MGNVAIRRYYVHTPVPFDVQYIQEAMSIDKEGKEERPKARVQPQKNIRAMPFLRSKSGLFFMCTLQRLALHLLENTRHYYGFFVHMGYLRRVNRKKFKFKSKNPTTIGKLGS